MNQYQIDLIEEPPPKSPYFTLPDAQYFLTPADIIKAQKSKSAHVSLVHLFGQFDKMSDDQQALFILTLIKYSDFKPDYDAMAVALNVTNGLHVRRRFVAIAQKHGFEMDLETGTILNDETPAAPGNNSPPEVTSTARKGKDKAVTDTPESQALYDARAGDTPTGDLLSNTPCARSIRYFGYTQADNVADAADAEDNVG